MLKSNLCDHSNVHITVKGRIDLLADAANENGNAQADVTQHIDKQ